MKTCVEPGCPVLTSGARCPDHTRTYDRRTHRSTARKVYASRRWRGVRRTVLKRNRWCAREDCRNLATDVDHVVPLEDVLAMGGDPYDLRNLQGLCKKHHSEKTAIETWGRT